MSDPMGSVIWARDYCAAAGRECLDALQQLQRYDTGGMVPDIHRDAHETICRTLRGLSGAMADMALALHDALPENRGLEFPADSH